MTKSMILLVIMIALLPIISFAQNKTYFGVEAAVTGDIYKTNDNGGQIKKTSFASGLYGINIKQQLANKLFLETGLLRKSYTDGVNFKSISGFSPNNEFNAWFIPIRLGTSINIHKNKLFIVPVLGYNFCINANYGEEGGSGASGSVTESNGNKVTYSYIANYNLAKTFSLLQTGIGIEFLLFKTASLTLNSNYYFGVKKINILDITYTTNSSAGTQSAESISKGNMTSVGVQLKYPISNFWVRSK